MALEWKLVQCCGFSNFRDKEGYFQKSSCPKPEGLELSYLACSIIVGLYQNASNYGSGVEIKPMLWGPRFHIEIKKEIFENLLVPNCKCWRFDIWYVASSSGPLPSLFI